MASGSDDPEKSESDGQEDTGEDAGSPEDAPSENPFFDDARTGSDVDSDGGTNGDTQDSDFGANPQSVSPDGSRSNEGIVDWLRWIRRTDHPGVTFLREFLGSMAVVTLIGVLLFAISGVWPPMVAVKSGSMQPHMYRGDLIFVMDEDRLVPRAAVHGTGVATYQSSQDTGYTQFGSYGDVIIYRPNGNRGIPIIHRARFWVADGENWYDEAKPAYVDGGSCAEVPNCPAPHAGFITKGDANGEYDQVNGISTVVKPTWIKGTAVFRIPWLGYVRLQFADVGLPVSTSLPRPLRMDYPSSPKRAWTSG